MSITLARFSQEVDVATGSMAVSYFAVFQSSDGRELKLPISEIASQELITFMADKPEKSAAAPTVEDEIHDEMVGEEYSEEDQQYATTFEDHQDESPPESEDEVPSL